jgi:hypothetical protein
LCAVDERITITAVVRVGKFAQAVVAQAGIGRKMCLHGRARLACQYREAGKRLQRGMFLMGEYRLGQRRCIGEQRRAKTCQCRMPALCVDFDLAGAVTHPAGQPVRLC